jgi:hypothetical protein
VTCVLVDIATVRQPNAEDKTLVYVDPTRRRARAFVRYTPAQAAGVAVPPVAPEADRGSRHAITVRHSPAAAPAKRGGPSADWLVFAIGFLAALVAGPALMQSPMGDSSSRLAIGAMNVRMAVYVGALTGKGIVGATSRTLR